MININKALNKEYTIDPTSGKYKRLFNTCISDGIFDPVTSERTNKRYIKFMGIRFDY